MLPAAPSAEGQQGSKSLLLGGGDRHFLVSPRNPKGIPGTSEVNFTTGESTGR